MIVRIFILCLSLCLMISCDTTTDINSQANKVALQSKPKPLISENMPPGEVSLFDGKNLGQWKITDFGGQGKVYTRGQSLIMEIGNNLTGVTWSGPVLRTNYEINLDAMRLDGEDFFCGLTFPVGDSCVTFIVGGWAGNLCGISSIDYYDASDNETTEKAYFDNNRWYHIRVRVEPGRIQCWIDKKQYVDLQTEGKKLSTRIEVEESEPLGISCWQTAAAIKNIRFTKLPDIINTTAPHEVENIGFLTINFNYTINPRHETLSTKQIPIPARRGKPIFKTKWPPRPVAASVRRTGDG